MWTAIQWIGGFVVIGVLTYAAARVISGPIPKTVEPTSHCICHQLAGLHPDEIVRRQALLVRVQQCDDLYAAHEVFQMLKNCSEPNDRACWYFQNADDALKDEFRQTWLRIGHLARVQGWQ